MAILAILSGSNHFSPMNYMIHQEESAYSHSTKHEVNGVHKIFIEIECSYFWSFSAK